MDVLLFLASFLLVSRLKKSIKLSPLSLKWASLMNVALGASAVLFVVSKAYFDNGLAYICGSALLLGIIVFAERERDFASMLPFLKAHYPLIGVGFIAGLVKQADSDFYDEYDKYFILPMIAAFIWVLAKWANTRKQHEEFRIITAQNALLDKQVAERTAELTKQKNELEQTVALLQTTQQQLVQSEKLASLGELTAGIAHEIQNPLNFVNNFSEVSMELVGEMEIELANGDTEEAIAIANDIRQNLEKIIHHGKRADGIVKGMLQHSRASNGVKENTNINTLADEYFRLAYHGLRAKDKSFNSELITSFDDKLPTVDVVPQDIGRVLLNLFTNAFYAVDQKQKSGVPGYKPEVTLSTRVYRTWIAIKVRDNGNGVPDAIKDKIMQPFFTTKPTGQGTGLGLSLSYDIIAKGHGGSIEVDTKEGEYSEFTVKIPIN